MNRTILIAAAIAAVAIPLSGCGLMTMATGRETCSDWSAHKAAAGKDRENEKAWAKSYFKSFYETLSKNPNVQGKGLNLQRDDERLLADMDEYCAGHPAANNGQAAQIAAFKETGITEFTRPTPASSQR